MEQYARGVEPTLRAGGPLGGVMGVYERFFKLHDEPFRLTPDPRYLFLSAKHREVLAHLRLGTAESGGFVCITGDVGTGKTTLIRSFLDQLDPGTPYAYLFNPPQSPLELLQSINAELGLPSAAESRKVLVDTLNGFLLAERRARRRVLVVVDEAQALAPEVLEELRLLSNLETTTAKLLQIVLFGQPQLADVLLSADLAQLNQRITHRWHLGPLSAQETSAYVRHRLRVAAGGVEHAVFSGRALRRIHAYAGGVPRLINDLSHRCLLAAYGAERPCVTVRTVEQVHDEIQRVPLRLASSRPKVTPRRAAWGLSAAALAAAVAWILVAAPFDLSDVRLPFRGVETEDGVADGARHAATRTPATPPAPAGRLAMMTSEVALPAGDQLPPPIAPALDDPGALRAAPPPTEGMAPEQLAAQMLVSMTEAGSTIAAINAVLARWSEPPLADDETILPMDLGAIAEHRELENLPISGTISMLRVVNLPAILELLLPSATGPRYAVLAGIDADRCSLEIDGQIVTVSRSFLDDYWLGDAHIVSRDFENLAPTLSKGSTGPRVRRLQEMLADLDVYSGPLTGIFDTDTEMAVVSFQRSRRLFADALVGRLTRITLYDALGGYEHPRLIATEGDREDGPDA